MQRRAFLKTLGLGAAVLAVPPWARAADTRRPNIIYILCDDLGYGDVQALNPTRGRIPTPNIDRLAREGLVFADAHSGSSVCTPTRYGILTGRYAWRTHLQKGVLGGWSPPLIAADRLTVPALLKQHGYRTACIGKWHLGMDWPRVRTDDMAARGEAMDWRGRVANGPITRGFDQYYGISASLDMAPFVFLENDRPLGVEKGVVQKKFVRAGPAAPDFEADQVLPTLTRRAVEYIGAQAEKARDGKPFFLYLPLNSPHAPIVPTAAFKGKSGLGAYGDFVMETDWAVGEVLKVLDDRRVADETIVVFTSDNGCSPVAHPDQLEAAGHFPSAQYRGYKSDAWDGGHRIPFIVRWPGTVKAGGICNRTICLTDLMATCAELLGAKLPDSAGEDSESFLSSLEGRDQSARSAVVHHSINGRFAIREGRWKLLLCPGSGGWGKPQDDQARTSGQPPVQLYNMDDDPGEKINVQDRHPEVVARLKQTLRGFVENGRSTPGAAQKNDVAVSWEAGPAKDGD